MMYEVSLYTEHYETLLRDFKHTRLDPDENKNIQNCP